MQKFSTVIVSNRLPVKVEKKDGKLNYIQSDGGLPTALASLDATDRVWIGWPGIANDDLTDEDRADITKELESRGCYPVFLSNDDVQLFYEGYANDTLWPLFHYFQSYMINRDEYWRSYSSVNRAYRDATTKFAKPDARIWIHDYHLMLLPGMVRAKLPQSVIGYFHHIPFPSYEVFRLLPERKELLEGLLGADLIGFHIYDYARHFLSSCLRLLGLTDDHGSVHVDGRMVSVDSFPISIDYGRFVSMRESPDAIAQHESLLETYQGQKIIFSEDRLDYSKGIPERLEGYRRFLEDNPDYLGQVVLIMVVSPSRTGVETYQQLQLQIEQLVSRINGEFGTAEWMPIVYQFQTLTLEEIVPMFMAADAMLVTPRRDGMNLVAKEYVVSKGDIPGVLILSEMAGAIDELPEALAVNPNDTLAIARALRQSFTMSKKEQIERLHAMQKRIKDHPVKRWGTDFMSELEKVHERQTEEAILDLKNEQLELLVDRFNHAKERVIMLDYDGTLQTFKSSTAPSAAAPSATLRKLIASLAGLPHTRLCIISGRSKDALDSWFGDTDAQLIAEHGAWTKRHGEWHKRNIDFEPAREAIQPILDDYTSRTPGSTIEHKDFASVWHYRNVPVDLALVRAYNLRHELRSVVDSDIAVHSGNKIIEVKPSSVTKQVAVEAILGEYDADFVLAAGDDYTDEGMFEAAPHDAYTIKVGLGETAASYRVAGVASMLKVLQRIVEADARK
ncbi:MAG TPA: bifunctional alpha,alpha-trehalose-phosphate synthase (UDP-forming)/trehalose-phosphatase [Patescibacteria group bacterium]|jgi:trehalose 6-phosphate synthase/phosphatase|nr:bifunctional alpha,alpha-trehalose-phosphate synthase (UDP-forming)/trehalose-phosphatase [Patescibacteria group bacterium]